MAALASISALVAGFLVGVVPAIPALNAAAPASATTPAACIQIGDTAANPAQANLTVTATHGKAFYIDSSTGQNIDAAYVGYQITSSTAQTGLWASLESFTGGVVSLANPADRFQVLPNFAANASRTAYFLLKATASSTAPQRHLLRVYDRRPDLQGATAVYTCQWTFLRVTETIKARANKVNSVAVSTTSPTLGSTLTVTVNGATGTVGAGKSPDFSAIWLSPVTRSAWPTTALRLERTSISLTTPGGRTETRTDQLLIPQFSALVASLKNNNKSADYTIEYTFRVIGRAASAPVIAPTAQIASGTQMKHNNLEDSTGLATIQGLTTVATTSVSVAKSVETTSSLTVSNGSLKVPYKVTVTNTGTAPVTVDQVIDTPDPAVTIDSSVVPTAQTWTSASASTTTNLTGQPFRTAASGGSYVFSGPFTIAAGQKVEVRYTALVPQCAGGGSTSSTFVNTAVARIGNTMVGAADGRFIPNVSLTATCGSTSVTATPGSTQLSPDALTQPATSVANTTATLNGLIDPNGQSGEAVTFEYGTTTSLGTSRVANPGTTGSGADPAAHSLALTGLTQGTRYYFRIRVGNVLGEILSFATTEPVTAVTVATDPATNISTTDATLNGTIDPNGNTAYVSVTASNNLVVTNGALTGGATVTILEDQAVSNSPVATFSGYFPTEVSMNMTEGFGSLIGSGRTVYFQFNYTDATGNILARGSIRSFVMTTYTTQTITFASILGMTYGGNAPTVNPTASSTLPVTLTSDSPLVCSINGFVITIVAAGECILTASQDGGQSGTTYFLPAEPVTQSFTVAPKPLAVNATVSDKQYDTTTSATLSSATLNGVVQADSANVVLAPPTVSFPDPTVGANKVMLTSGPFTLTGSKAGNYTVTQPTLTASITAAPLTIEVDDKSKQLNAADPVLTFTVLGFLGSDATTTQVVGVTLARDPGETVGTYAITANTSNATIRSINTQAVNPNYIIQTNNPGVFTISNKQIPELSWSTPAPIVYGTPLSATQLNATVSGGVVGTFTYSPASGILGAGTRQLSVTFTPTGTDANNFDPATAHVFLVVTKATLTVTASSPTVNFGGDVPPITPAYSGFVNNENESLGSANVTGVTCSTTYTVTSEVGSSPTTSCSGGSAANYTLVYVNGSVTVSGLSRTLALAGAGPNVLATNVPSWGGTTALVANPSAGSGDGAITYRLAANSAGCTVNSTTGVVTFTGAGTCRIDSTITQGSSYNQANSNVIEFTVGPKDHTITLPTTGPGQVGDADRTLPTGTSQLQSVTYSTNDPNVCTIVGSAPNFSVRLVGPGTCTVTANSPASTNFNAAPQAIWSFAVTGVTPPPSVTPPVTPPTTPRPIENPRTQPPAPREVVPDAKKEIEGPQRRVLDLPGTTPATPVRILEPVKNALAQRIVVTPSNGDLVVTPVNGWTGRTVVPVITVRDNQEVEVLVEVTVNPDAPAQGTFTPRRMDRTTLTWEPSKSQVVRYEVEIDGERACAVATNTCVVNEIVGPKSVIEVTAIGNDNTQSTTVLPAYKPERPIPALVVNFAEDSSVLTPQARRQIRNIARIIEREGFTSLQVFGHTDSQGGQRNAAPLSRARAEVTRAFFQRLLPNVRFRVVAGFGLDRPVASNTNERGRAANRRAELQVVR